ncbi:hypothetical protein D3C85_425780 [compost metagenome]
MELAAVEALRGLADVGVRLVGRARRQEREVARACYHLIIRSVVLAPVLILALTLILARILALILAQILAQPQTPTQTQPLPHRFHTGQGYTVSAQL